MHNGMRNITKSPSDVKHGLFYVMVAITNHDELCPNFEFNNLI